MKILLTLCLIGNLFVGCANSDSQSTLAADESSDTQVEYRADSVAYVSLKLSESFILMAGTSLEAVKKFEGHDFLEGNSELDDFSCKQLGIAIPLLVRAISIAQEVRDQDIEPAELSYALTTLETAGRVYGEALDRNKRKCED